MVDLAFAGADNFERVTEPFLAALGNRLAIWIDHHEHPVGWSRVRGDPRFVLVPNREAHACPELVTPEVVRRAGAVDVVVAHADMDGLLSAVKFLRGGIAPWPEADEDARASDSPGRGHAFSARGKLLHDALGEAQSSLRSKPREAFRQELAAALVALPAPIPPGLQGRLTQLAREHAATIAPAEALAESAREEAGSVLVVRVQKDLGRALKKELLSLLEERAAVGVVVEGHAITAATFRAEIDLAGCAELSAGRSDYRFAQLTDDGRAIISRIGQLVRDAS